MSRTWLKILVIALLLVCLPVKAATAPVKIIPSDCSIFLNQKDRTTLEGYVSCEAQRKGINSSAVVWIMKHESEGDEKRIGDKGYRCPYTGKIEVSRGLFQINRCYWPEVTEADSMDARKSTEWALEHIKENPKIWSSVKHCKAFYKSCPNL